MSWKWGTEVVNTIKHFSKFLQVQSIAQDLQSIARLEILKFYTTAIDGKYLSINCNGQNFVFLLTLTWLQGCYNRLHVDIFWKKILSPKLHECIVTYFQPMLVKHLKNILIKYRVNFFKCIINLLSTSRLHVIRIYIYLDCWS